MTMNRNAFTSARRAVPPEGTRRARTGAAFSLIELLVTVTILTVIVFALYAVFNQVQKAMLSSVAQVDVLEGGRSAFGLVGRDVEQLVYPRWGGPNLYIRNSYPNTAPVVQSLELGNPQSALRTNVLQEVYFIAKSNLHWTGNAYYVGHWTNALKQPTSPSPLVGTLYRYSAAVSPPGTLSSWQGSSNQFARLVDQFVLATQGNTNYTPYLNPVVQGVVHFRWQAFDINGREMTNYNTGAPSRYFTGFSNAPSYLEFELGVLEPQTFEQYKSFPDKTVARQFLERQASKVHLFRQRVPLRSNL